MFRNRGLFSGLWKPKNPHSLEHLKYLYTVLSKNQTVTQSNKELLVETMRSISEILIWGDQNDSSVFDFFLERNMHSYFLKIIDQKCGSYVCVQILQTLNILFENIRNETSIYYLLSNNHVNSIIVYRFDFSDEEIMAYYISFLKTLSFRLNKHTIHFFYNEHTNDFPLYTEAIKFFNHSENMVRIAVRTLSLNVYKVDDDAMLKFVIDKTAAPYFSNLVWFIGSHILEIDSCVRTDADHKSLNKLKDLVAEHLDHLHYVNDILNLNIDSLNRVLSDHLLNRLFIPLYMYSMARNSTTPSEDMKPHVSQIVSLFLLCQVFLVITHNPLVRLLAWIITAGDAEVFTERGATLYATSPRRKANRLKPSFKAPTESLEKQLAERIRHKSESDSEDTTADPERSSSPSTVAQLTLLPSPFHIPNPPTGDDPAALSITDEEKLRLSSTNPPFSLENRPFLTALFLALEYTDNDYVQLFALCLFYAMQTNTGINKELLESVSIPGPDSDKLWYNIPLVEKLIQIISAGCQYGSKVRLVTLELIIESLKLMVIRGGSSVLQDNHFAQVEGAREESILILRNFYKSEEIFLDMFEDEHREMMKKPLNVVYIMSDASLLLPPTGTPLTGIEFRKRHPCGEVERARKAIRTFFLLRQVSLALQGTTETQLPLSDPDACVQAGDVLDLNNSDLLAVTVVTKDNTRQRRFLVVDVMQIILVEPDAHRLGWGVAKFSGFLQDLEVVSDKDDSRCVHVTVHKPSAGTSKGTPTPLLSATFTFDDHIRCMAAKQRLTKGRIKARQRKMHMIARLLELPGNVGAACPSPPHHTLNTLRQEARRARSTQGAGGTHSPRQSIDHGNYRPIFGAGQRVPGAASLLRPREDGTKRKSSSPRRGGARREPSPALEEGGIRMETIPRVPEARREPSPALEEGGIRMEPIPRVDVDAEGSSGRNQEEETCFEYGRQNTTWHVDQEEEDLPRRRGAVHDV